MLATEVTFNLRNNGAYRILASSLGTTAVDPPWWPRSLTGDQFSSQIILTPDNGSFVYSNRGMISDVIFNISKLGDPNNYALLSFMSFGPFLSESGGVEVFISGHYPVNDIHIKKTYEFNDTYNTLSITTDDEVQYNFGFRVPSIYSNDLIAISCDFL